MLLYKFRSIDGNSFRNSQDIFVNKRLFLPPAKTLNDPNEGIAIIDINNDFRLWGNQIEERNRRQDLRICSFSTDHRNSVIWSHYANQHKGICIEFDSNEFEQMDSQICPVKYSNTVPVISHNSDSTKVEAFLNKTLDWGYEKEWRYIADTRNPHFSFSNKAIKRVLLGARFAESDIEWVNFWIKSFQPAQPIPVVKMTFAIMEYTLYEESELNQKSTRLLI